MSCWLRVRPAISTRARVAAGIGPRLDPRQRARAGRARTATACSAARASPCRRSRARVGRREAAVEALRRERSTAGRRSARAPGRASSAARGGGTGPSKSTRNATASDSESSLIMPGAIESDSPDCARVVGRQAPQRRGEAREQHEQHRRQRDALQQHLRRAADGPRQRRNGAAALGGPCQHLERRADQQQRRHASPARPAATGCRRTA